MLHIDACAKQDDRCIPIDALSELKLKEPLYIDGSIRVTALCQR